MTANGQWISGRFRGLFGNGSNAYNGTNPMIGLKIDPTINVATTSTGTYAALLVNPTETQVGTGTLNYLARFQKGGTDEVDITSTGNVGIATASPQTRLDVNGTIRFAYGGESCSASTVGGLYYSSATHLMYGCLTAPTWTQIATAAGSPAAGSAPRFSSTPAAILADRAI